MNAVFLLCDRPWSLGDVRDELSRSGLAIADAASDRLVVTESPRSRVYVGLARELDLGLRNSFGAVDLQMLLEVEYTSLAMLFRVLESIDRLRPAVVDNDHGFHGALTDLLRTMAEQPGWDWRIRRA